MKIDLRPLVAVAVFTMGLSACSGHGASPVPPAMSQTFARSLDATGPASLYVSLQLSNLIQIFDPVSGKSTGTITAGLVSPFGIALDHTGALYVTNLGSASSGTSFVTVYRKGHTNPVNTYPQGITESARGVAVARDGTMYVLDRKRANPSATCHLVVEVYPPGQMTPQRTLHLPQQATCFIPAIALDTNDNVYVEFDTSDILVSGYTSFAAGASRGTTTILPNFATVTGIAIDPAGNVLLNGCQGPLNPSGEGCGAEHTWLFPPGATAPTQDLTDRKYMAGAETLVFSADHSRFYVVNYQSLNLYAFSYPQGRMVRKFVMHDPSVRGTAVGVGP